MTERFTISLEDELAAQFDAYLRDRARERPAFSRVI